jgi:predicted transglutaminase-like cysteine proteinase
MVLDRAGEILAARIIGPIAEGLRAVSRSAITFEPAAGAAGRMDFSVPASSRPAPQPAGHGAFASVAIPVGNIGMAERWAGAVARDYTGFFTGDCEALDFANCDTTFGRAMHRAFNDAQGLSEVAMLRLVNQRINGAIRYKSDLANWGVGDHWATPSEIARKGAGDCEDYAIAKMWMLRALGFAPEQLQLVVVQDTRRQLYHAVLAVHVGGERYVLDNLSNVARLDSMIGNYMPLVSFAANKTFIHGFDQTRAVNVAMPSDLGAVRPGEGV